MNYDAQPIKVYDLQALTLWLLTDCSGAAPKWVFAKVNCKLIAYTRPACFTGIYYTQACTTGPLPDNHRPWLVQIIELGFQASNACYLPALTKILLSIFESIFGICHNYSRDITAPLAENVLAECSLGAASGASLCSGYQLQAVPRAPGALF